MEFTKRILLLFTLLLFMKPTFANTENFQKLQDMAKKGDASAQNKLGDAYYDGESITQNYTKAFECFSKAAVQGLATAQYSLGLMYSYGDGVSQNDAKAFEWYSKSN